jgi:hypothetical protein
VGLRHLVGIGPHVARSVTEQNQQIVRNIGGHRSPSKLPVTPGQPENPSMDFLKHR